MASLSPAQRRVLEAAHRGDLRRMFNGQYFEANADGIGVHNVTDEAEPLADSGLIGDGQRWAGGVRDAVLTAAGRAELGITDTEEG